MIEDLELHLIRDDIVYWKCDETAARLGFYQDRRHGSLIDRGAWRWDGSE